MTKKLSAIDRQRVSNALTKCAAATKDIEKNEELADRAYQILSKELGDNPGLFKAACQVYNSCKSIHKLSAADDNTRGNSFSILNVRDMCDRLGSEKAINMRKSASAPATFGKVTKVEVPTAVMRKSASAVKPTENNSSILTSKDAEDSYPTFLIAELEDAEKLLYKSANAVRSAERQFKHATEMFVSSMATERADIRKEAAARLYANYGLPVIGLVDMFGEQRPLQKLATADYAGKYKGTPSLLKNQITDNARAAIEAGILLEARTKMHDEVLEKTANMVLDHCKHYYGLGKKAAEGGLAGLVVKSTAVKELASLLGDSDESKDMAKDIFNTEFINNMLAHSHRRSFMRAAMNDALSKYPLSKLVPAYNKAVASLPANNRLVPATANQALIESLMSKELATGSVPSKADVELISSLADTIGKLKVKDGRVEGAVIE